MPVDPATDLGQLVRAAAEGSPPPSDGSITVLPQPPGPVAAALAFTGHHMIAGDVHPELVSRRLAPGDMSASVSPIGADLVFAER